MQDIATATIAAQAPANAPCGRLATATAGQAGGNAWPDVLKTIMAGLTQAGSGPATAVIPPMAPSPALLQAAGPQPLAQVMVAADKMSAPPARASGPSVPGQAVGKSGPSGSPTAAKRAIATPDDIQAIAGAAQSATPIVVTPIVVTPVPLPVTPATGPAPSDPPVSVAASPQASASVAVGGVATGIGLPPATQQAQPGTPDPVPAIADSTLAATPDAGSFLDASGLVAPALERAPAQSQSVAPARVATEPASGTAKSAKPDDHAASSPAKVAPDDTSGPAAAKPNPQQSLQEHQAASVASGTITAGPAANAMMTTAAAQPGEHASEAMEAAPKQSGDTADQVDQVARAVIRLVDTSNGGRLIFQLAPEHLGRVEVQIDGSGPGLTHITLIVQHPETMALLQQDQVHLAAALDRGGVSNEGRSISFRSEFPPHHDHAVATHAAVPTTNAPTAEPDSHPRGQLPPRDTGAGTQGFASAERHDTRRQHAGSAFGTPIADETAPEAAAVGSPKTGAQQLVMNARVNITA